jgi:hypothetical protein
LRPGASDTALFELLTRKFAAIATAVGGIRGVCQPDLSEFEVIYLFVDGIAERLHLGQPREAVLAAWGVLADGHKVLLHLAPGIDLWRGPAVGAGMPAGRL